MATPPRYNCILSNAKSLSFPSNSKKGIFRRKIKKDLATSLRSYTRAINVQENRSGSLFREGTKFKNNLKDKFITVNHRDFTNDNSYARNCFEYIHQNPVKAKMVTKAEDWEFSSAKDYLGLRKETISNVALGEELMAYH